MNFPPHTKKQKSNIFVIQSSCFEHNKNQPWNRLWQMDRFNYFEVAVHLSYLSTLSGYIIFTITMKPLYTEHVLCSE